MKLALAALGGAVGGALFVALLYMPALTPYDHIPDGTVIAIRSKHTGKYLSVSTEDGLLRLVANSSSSAATQFRLVALSTAVVTKLRPAKVRKPMVSKKLCVCSGFSDEHGFGKFCHAWESEHHRPWCYVEDKCQGAKKGEKPRKHQACSADSGFLGPQGW